MEAVDIKGPDADCCKFTARAHKVVQNDDSYLHSLRGVLSCLHEFPMKILE